MERPLLSLKAKRWYGSFDEYFLAKVTAMACESDVDVNCLKLITVPTSLGVRQGS